jgi:hypothetical protein
MEMDVTEAIALSIRTGLIATFPEVYMQTGIAGFLLIPSANPVVFPRLY